MLRAIAMALTLIVRLSTVVSDCSEERNRTIRIGLLQPLETELGFEQTASATTMAIEDARNSGILNGTNIE